MLLPRTAGRLILRIVVFARRGEKISSIPTVCCRPELPNSCFPQLPIYRHLQHHRPGIQRCWTVSVDRHRPGRTRRDGLSSGSFRPTICRPETPNAGFRESPSCNGVRSSLIFAIRHPPQFFHFLLVAHTWTSTSPSSASWGLRALENHRS